MLVDIDLAILAAPPRRFAQYQQQIRAEYACVAEPPFAARRRSILRSFLDRESTYATPYFQARFEAFGASEPRARHQRDHLTCKRKPWPTSKRKSLRSGSSCRRP